MDDDLTILTASSRISGWTGISVTRGIERFPSGFTVSMSERYDGGNLRDVAVKPGDPLQVLLGSDVVVTGYADRFVPTLRARRHSIALVGRGKCQDLVDCSHAWDGCQMSSVTVEAIAQGLAAPYGISVTALADVGAPIPQVNLAWGDTPYSVIEQHARYRQLLVYEDAYGNLVLNQATLPTKGASYPTIEEGKTLEAGGSLFAMDQRFSEYVVRRLAIDSMSDVGGGPDVLATFTDPGVPRFRRRSIIAETGDGADFSVSKARGQWEAARRAGRSLAVNLTVDSWRNGSGKLWEPNTLVTVTAPSLRLQGVTWLISEVTYRRDETGTHADLVVMPPQAFFPQPILLFPGLQDVLPATGASQK
jgi:prophage tail gpP-like protein